MAIIAKNIKKLLLILPVLLLLISCSTTRYSSPRGVRLGMTKHEVVEMVGRSCKLVSTKQTPEGIYETMEYIKSERGINDDVFIYYFFNDKLTEWHAEVLEPRKSKKSRSKPDTSNRRP